MMKIKKLADVPTVETPGYTAVVKQVVLGPEDGSEEIILRYFTVAPGGATPYHNHDFPHLVKIEAGQGVAVDADKNETPVVAGDYVYVHDDEIHNFKNTGDGTFEFICLVPMRGELSGACCAMPPEGSE
ncbi:MAG: cupin domain-containing protein [Planctomycetota bacterium]|jgi:quercetin dioxygenase-like cupin family protein